jgi:hypothetical protein
MKNIKNPFDFFKELSESVSAGNRSIPNKLHLKNSYIFEPRLNYNHEALIKDLYIILDKAVLTKTAVMDIIESYTAERNIESIVKLTKTRLSSLIKDLNVLIIEKENLSRVKNSTPDGKVHYGKCINKKTKEKGDLYYDPLEKNWLFVNLDGEEKIFETPHLFTKTRNS